MLFAQCRMNGKNWVQPLFGLVNDLRAFIALWRTEAGCRLIFGDFGARRPSPFLMFTLTADGRQLRCWFGPPSHADRCHVDGGSDGMLFEVIAPSLNDPDLVALTEALTAPENGQPQYEKLVSSNGTSYWVSASR